MATKKVLESTETPVVVTLYRESPTESWGFVLGEGGVILDTVKGTIARQRVNVGMWITKVDDHECIGDTAAIEQKLSASEALTLNITVAPDPEYQWMIIHLNRTDGVWGLDLSPKGIVVGSTNSSLSANGIREAIVERRAEVFSVGGAKVSGDGRAAVSILKTMKPDAVPIFLRVRRRIPLTWAKEGKNGERDVARTIRIQKKHPLSPWGVVSATKDGTIVQVNRFAKQIPSALSLLGAQIIAIDGVPYDHSTYHNAFENREKGVIVLKLAPKKKKFRLGRAARVGETWGISFDKSGVICSSKNEAFPLGWCIYRVGEIVTEGNPHATKMALTAVPSGSSVDILIREEKQNSGWPTFLSQAASPSDEKSVVGQNRREKKMFVRMQRSTATHSWGIEFNEMRIVTNIAPGQNFYGLHVGMTIEAVDGVTLNSAELVAKALKESTSTYIDLTVTSHQTKVIFQEWTQEVRCHKPITYGCSLQMGSFSLRECESKSSTNHQFFYEVPFIVDSSGAVISAMGQKSFLQNKYRVFMVQEQYFRTDKIDSLNSAEDLSAGEKKDNLGSRIMKAIIEVPPNETLRVGFELVDKHVPENKNESELQQENRQTVTDHYSSDAKAMDEAEVNTHTRAASGKAKKSNNEEISKSQTCVNEPVSNKSVTVTDINESSIRTDNITEYQRKLGLFDELVKESDRIKCNWMWASSCVIDQALSPKDHTAFSVTPPTPSIQRCLFRLLPQNNMENLIRAVSRGGSARVDTSAYNKHLTAVPGLGILIGLRKATSCFGVERKNGNRLRTKFASHQGATMLTTVETAASIVEAYSRKSRYLSRVRPDVHPVFGSHTPDERSPLVFVAETAPFGAAPTPILLPMSVTTLQSAPSQVNLRTESLALSPESSGLALIRVNLPFKISRDVTKWHTQFGLEVPDTLDESEAEAFPTPPPDAAKIVSLIEPYRKGSPTGNNNWAPATEGEAQALPLFQGSRLRGIITWQGATQPATFREVSARWFKQLPKAIRL